jgi:hypothetical protein
MSRLEDYNESADGGLTADDEIESAVEMQEEHQSVDQQPKNQSSKATKAQDADDWYFYLLFFNVNKLDLNKMLNSGRFWRTWPTSCANARLNICSHGHLCAWCCLCQTSCAILCSVLW